MENRACSDFVTRLYELAWDADENGLFKIGPWDALVGKQLSELEVAEQAGLFIELDQPSLYEEVDLNAPFIPAAIEGRVSAEGVGEYVAIAVNGTVQVVAPIFDDKGGQHRFQAIVPEKSFLNGLNRVQAFAVVGGNGKTILHFPQGSRSGVQ